MMTISESQYSSNKMSSIHKVNDRVVHKDSFDDVTSSSSVNSSLITKRGFKPSDMFDPKKKEFLTNLSYKLFPVSWVSYYVPLVSLDPRMRLTVYGIYVLYIYYIFTYICPQLTHILTAM